MPFLFRHSSLVEEKWREQDQMERGVDHIPKEKKMFGNKKK
jgi:hypothetical protein